MLRYMYDLCVDQTTAKLMLMYEDEGQNKIVQSHAYSEVVHKIAAGVEDVSVETLLRVAKLELVTLIKGKNIINTLHAMGRYIGQLMIHALREWPIHRPI